MIKQAIINAGCEAAKKRYDAMPADKAQLQFSYDLQGFLASMNDRREWPLPHGIAKVVELLDILARQNEI